MFFLLCQHRSQVCDVRYAGKADLKWFLVKGNVFFLELFSYEMLPLTERGKRKEKAHHQTMKHLEYSGVLLYSFVLLGCI